jgi:uncharacterized repeat protein (TIGR01451 family)
VHVTVTVAPGTLTSFENDVTATVPDPANPGASFTGSASDTDAGPQSSVDVVKHADVTSAALGSAIHYTFTVTNTGDTSLSAVQVVDNLAAPAGPALTVTCPTTVLVPGDSLTCTASAYTVTKADADAGSVSNSATASAQPATSESGTVPPRVSSSTSSASVTIAPAPALTVLKSASPMTLSAAGQSVTYSFLVTNTGNVTLSGINVTDTQSAPASALSAAPVCPVTTLAAGDSTTCTATYVATQADVNNGQIVDSAIAHGTGPTPPGGVAPAVTNSFASSVTVSIAAAPALTIKKTASPTTFSAVGSLITYSFAVKNTGNVSLNPITVTDVQTAPAAALTSGPTCPAGALAPGASVTCTATYTATQADLDSGSIVDTATAHGTGPTPAGGVAPAATNSTPDSATVTASASPALTVTKTASAAPVHKIGDTVTYSFLVKNTGNVTLSTVNVTDAQTAPTAGALAAPTCPVTTLAPNATVSCTATYALTQADVDNGSVSDTAAAHGTSAHAGIANSSPSSATVTIAAAPALTVLKSASVLTVSHVGDTITYSFLITNTGNVTLSSVTAVEGAFTGVGGTPAAPVVNCPTSTLAPSTTLTCTATYAVSQHDLDAGSISNTATATGTPPVGAAVTALASTAVVTVVADPSLTLQKSVAPMSASNAGDIVTYTILITNNGNVTLSNVKPTETAFSGSGPALSISCPAGANSLAPGAAVTCTASYLVTQADVNKGTNTNTATASGKSPAGVTATSTSSGATVTIASVSTLSLVKSASPSDVASYVKGTVVTYSFAITNTGNTTLTNVHLLEGSFTGTNALAAPTCPAGAASLAPGDQVICSTQYTLVQGDIDHGSISNTASAEGTSPTSTVVDSADSTANDPISQSPDITVSKTASVVAVAEAGDPITYSFLITNTGNVTLANVHPTEGTFTGTPALSPTCPAAAASLVPGGQVTCTATYATTQADMDAGIISNSATATGTPPASVVGGPPVSDPSNVDVTATQAASMTLTKTSDIALVSTAGQVITYSFLITNTGNVTLTDVAPVEGTFGGQGTAPVITCPAAADSVAPGASVTCTAPYTVVAADLTSTHQLLNTATAIAVTPTSDPEIAPVAAASTAAVTAQKVLAFTGDNGNAIAIGAFSLIIAGGALWLIAVVRRRRSRGRHLA